MTDKPMTIDHLARDFHAYSFEVGSHFSRGDCDMIATTLDAAIRERDHLRGNNRWLTDLLDDREAALAALRKRIADAKLVSLGAYPAHGGGLVEIVMEPTKGWKRVRLLVEDDDEL